MVNRYAGVLIVASAAIGGCSLLYTVEGYENGGAAFVDASTADDSSADATSPTDSSTTITREGGACPQDMVNVGTFCIDRTEVTQAKYDEFLKGVNVSAAIASLPPRCTWNTSFVPGFPGDGGVAENTFATNCQTTDFYTPTATPNLPVECVDWCDSYAYCAFRGKRLCGAIAGGAGALASSEDATKSQWYRACAGETGALVYPYGATYSEAACPTTDLVDVGSRPGCVGSVPNLFDLSGNVSEWTDECDGTSKSARCGRRGGAFSDKDVDLACKANTDGDSDITHMSLRLGFRCCLD